ncbi:hypothetical protein AWV80_04120 [Cupriavidus sp. UYMU48A]|nr:hypothetical protein AWV80_04120 [Cupriavidus sp. UYMU48A]UIF87627.1 hypothetical protein KAF44_09300 [Cupriavidus necator]
MYDVIEKLRAVRHPPAVIPPYVERTYRFGQPAQVADADGRFTRYWMYAAPESHYRVVGLRLFEQMPVVASSQFAVAVVKGVIGVLIVAFAFLELWSLAACAFPLLL